MFQGGAEPLLPARVHGGVEFADDAGAGQLKDAAFAVNAEFLIAEDGLARGCAAGCCLLLLRLDVFAFPPAGHASILAGKGGIELGELSLRAGLY